MLNPSQTVTASKKSHPDLFWALRGGVGSNFGIINEIKYKIIDVPDVVVYSMTWPWESATKVLRLWIRTSKNRPFQFNEDLHLHHNPLTKSQGIELSGIYVCVGAISEKHAQNEIYSQLKVLGGILKISKKKPYSNQYTALADHRIYFNFSIIQPLFTNKINPEYVVKQMNRGTKLPGPISFSLTLLGGLISSVSPSETAFYPRQKKFFVDIATFWQNMSESYEMESWTNNMVRNILKVEDTYAYVGFPITFSNIVHTNRIYFGKNYHRLQKLKKYYDPLNILTSCGTID